MSSVTQREGRWEDQTKTGTVFRKQEVRRRRNGSVLALDVKCLSRWPVLDGQSGCGTVLPCRFNGAGSLSRQEVRPMRALKFSGLVLCSPSQIALLFSHPNRYPMAAQPESGMGCSHETLTWNRIECLSFPRCALCSVGRARHRRTSRSASRRCDGTNFANAYVRRIKSVRTTEPASVSRPAIRQD